MKEPYRRGVANRSRLRSHAPAVMVRSTGEALTGGTCRPAIELRNHIIFRRADLVLLREGNTMQYDDHREATRGRRGVRDPEHAWKLPAREPGDPENVPASGTRNRGRCGTVRKGILPQTGHARFQGVGRSHSTEEAGEQRWTVIGGVRGGKGIDQGKRRTDLTRAGRRAGQAWHGIARRTATGTYGIRNCGLPPSCTTSRRECSTTATTS